MNTEETGSLDSIVPKVEHDVSIKEVINVENIIAKTEEEYRIIKGMQEQIIRSMTTQISLSN